MNRKSLIPLLLSAAGILQLSGCSAEGTDAFAFVDDTKASKSNEKSESSNSNHAKKHPANRLANESSPYLLLHAHNPVDWFPWGPEAFAKAQKEGKPIFLSIGYSSCFWCHVMERKVFSNEEIAKYMNEHFVNIKIDREERPDIDDIYMTSLHLYFQLTGSSQGGGWPLSMFLTPKGQPFAGGTYFPPEDEGGRIGFSTLMTRINKVWTEQREAVEGNAETLTAHVRRTMQPKFALSTTKIEKALVKQAADALTATFDAQFGGVDFNADNPDRPKFPVPAKLALLQHEIRTNKGEETQKVVYHTLDQIAAGGIQDHLAGGFHRYSTDRAWMVPHFEKMLYDNAQLADVYVEAFRQTGKPMYREVAEGIFRFVLADMTHPQGGFYSALDAETDAVEGKYYAWSTEEIDEILSEKESGVFKTVFGMQERKYFEHGYVLHLPKTIEQVAAAQKISRAELLARIAVMRQKVLAARKQRKSPLRDDKVLASWNGLMIRAFANAGNVLQRPDYIKVAERAAMFILTEMRDADGRLLRTWRNGKGKLNAYVDDYAFVVDGLLAIHKATDDAKWLNAARRLTDRQIEMFWDEKTNGFFFTSHNHEVLIARTKNAYDSVIPSGNSVGTRNLIRLTSLTGEEKYREYAHKNLQLFAQRIKESPRSMAVMTLAMAEFLESETEKPAPPTPPKRNKKDDPKPTSKNAKKADDAILLVSSDAGQTKEQRQKEVVVAKAYLSVDKLPAGEKCQLAVVLEIKQNWHINTNPAKPDFLIPTTLKIVSKQGLKLSNVRYPKGKLLKVEGLPDASSVYDGRLAIHGTLEIPAKSLGNEDEIEIRVRYQPCTDQKCLRPKTIKLRGKLEIIKPSAVKLINQKFFAPKKPATGKKGK